MSNTPLKELFRNPIFIIGMVILLFNLMVTLGGSMIRPDDSAFANAQYLELSTLKPLTEITYLKIKRNNALATGSLLENYFVGNRPEFTLLPYDSIGISNDQLVVKKYRQPALIAFSTEELYNDLALAHSEKEPWIENGHVLDKNTSLNEVLVADLTVSKTAWLGTDKFGRDLLSRLMAGCAISLSVGFISVLISLIVGMTLGLCAGYFRGWTDRIIVWFINVIWSVPTLLLVIAITLVLGKGYWQIFIAVGLTMWVEVARIVRGQVMSIREKEFIEAGVVLGLSNFRIIWRHIVPNILSPVIVISAANFATAILLEAGLSFLGIGAPPPQATWGKMISEHKGYLITGDAYLAIIPGLAIMFLVLAFTFIGNGLRDAFDERMLKRS